MFTLQSEYFFTLLGMASLLSVAALAVALMLKTNKISQLQISVNNLKRSLDEMDEQAKLVVRTDIELNRAQEELDKKVTGLYTLQKLTRAISTTLEESQIFKMIEPEYLEDLGFEKACGFLYDEGQRKYIPCLNIGYSDEGIANIVSFMDLNKGSLADLIKGSTAAPENIEAKKNIKNIFGVNHFILSMISPEEGKQGFLFFGTDKSDTSVTEGDEELITILTNQINQALENARLFEKTWQAHQELEKRVEERTRELSLALEEVKKISKRKTDFVSSVSHELRTPLTSIKGYASILLAGKLGEVPEEAYKRLEKINKHSDELVQFVNDLLDISRIESGRAAMKLIPLNLKTVVEEVADMLSIQLKEKGIEFSYDIPGDIPEALADREQIKRVFINLINNALKYTPQGKIGVTVRGFDKKIQIDISDTGCGIPEGALEKIFEEFYRVDSPMNQELKGTGLGLSLVKNIVEAQGGKIWVKSKAGEGSVFSFTLPRAI